jgi:NitT/TauT family transport system substrate-binding protein
MNKKNVFITGFCLIILIAVILILKESNNSTGNADEYTIRIPDTKFMGLLPLYVADEKGFFRENKIKIEWVDVKDPGQAEKTFLSGHADLNATTFANLLQAEIREPGTISLLVPTNESSDKPGSYFLVGPKSNIQSLPELKGKKIGTYSGPSQKAYLQIVMSKLGFTIDKDYELIQVSSAAQIQSLFAGTFDVLFTVEPYGTVALMQGAKVLENGIRTKYIQDPFWIGSFEVKKDLTKDRIRMSSLLTALKSAIDFIKNNDAESRTILSKRTNVDISVAKACFLYNWITGPSEKDIDEMQNLIKLLAAEKLLEKEIEINPILYKE